METLIATAVTDKNQISVCLDDDFVRIQYNGCADNKTVGIFSMSRRKFLSRLDKTGTRIVAIPGFTLRMIVDDEIVHFNARTVDDFSPSLVMEKVVLRTLIRAL